MRVAGALFIALFCCRLACAFAATNDPSTVNIRFEQGDHRKLRIEGKTYSMLVNCTDAVVEKFTVAGEELIGETPICPIINTGKVNGPGQVEIAQCGPALAEIRLRQLWWTDLDAKIEYVFYCYPTRVFMNMELDFTGPPRELMIGWFGSAKYVLQSVTHEEDVNDRASFKGQDPRCAVVIPSPAVQAGKHLKGRIRLQPPKQFTANYGFPADFEGTRRVAIAFLASTSHEEFKRALRAEWASQYVKTSCDAGVANGYVARAGYFDFDCSSWPGTGQVGLAAEVDAAAYRVDAPFQAVFCIRNALGVSTICDKRGVPLPTPAQITQSSENRCNVFATTTIVPDSQTALSLRAQSASNVQLLSDGAAFFSTRNNKPAFNYLVHDRLAPIATGFAIQPGGAPQYVSMFRYHADGKWVSQRAQRADVYLTGPKLANMGAEYCSADGKVKTRIEVFEPAQTDALRSYVKLLVEALDAVNFDGSSTRAFRLFESIAPKGKFAWRTLAYLADDGTERSATLEGDGFPVDGVALAKESPYVAAFGESNRNLGWFVSRVEGTNKGMPIEQLALGCEMKEGSPHIYLTVPNISGMEKGDRVEAHVFLMPYEDAEKGAGPVAAQRPLYGAGLARIKAQQGTTPPGYPRRIKLGEAGRAEFDIHGGAQQTPIIIDGLPEHTAPVLKARSGDGWNLVGGAADAYQLFRAADGTYSAIFLLDLAPDGVQHFAAAFAN